MYPEIEKGRRAVLIAKRLWPGLQLVEEGGEADRNGQDAFFRLGGLRVQIKAHEPMARYGDVYLELFEKTRWQPQQRWRVGLAHADAYIFVAPGMAVWLSLDALAEAVKGKAVRQINPTSIGFIIPLSDIPDGSKTVKHHDFWDQHMLV